MKPRILKPFTLLFFVSSCLLCAFLFFSPSFSIQPVHNVNTVYAMIAPQGGGGGGTFPNPNAGMPGTGTGCSGGSLGCNGGGNSAPPPPPPPPANNPPPPPNNPPPPPPKSGGSKGGGGGGSPANSNNGYAGSSAYYKLSQTAGNAHNGAGGHQGKENSPLPPPSCTNDLGGTCQNGCNSSNQTNQGQLDCGLNQTCCVCSSRGICFFGFGCPSGTVCSNPSSFRGQCFDSSCLVTPTPTLATPTSTPALAGPPLQCPSGWYYVRHNP